MLLELMAAVITAGQVFGYPDLDDVGTTHPCCHHWHRNSWPDFYSCVGLTGEKPMCEVSRQGCNYHGKTYKVGATVAVFPDKCLRLECVQHDAFKTSVAGGDLDSERHLTDDGGLPAPSTELLVPMIESVTVDLGCGCCMRDGRMYPNGYKDKIRGHVRQTCEDGTWVSKALNSLCLYTFKDCTVDGVVFKHGDVIELQRDDDGTDCSKLWCHDGQTRLESYDCCCICGGEMFPCGRLTRPVADSCIIETCDNGVITTVHHQDCCIMNGKMYVNQQRIQLSGDICNAFVCSSGRMIKVPSGKCCPDLQGKLVPPGGAVLKDASKCLLTVCTAGGKLVDLSIPDLCGCCEMDGNLFVNGSNLHLSTCITLICINSTWTAEPSDTCFTCSIGYPRIETFDDLSYEFFGDCNYIMVQKGTVKRRVPSISTQFRVCSEPFTDVLSCVGKVVINHSRHVKVTLLVGGRVKVNGALVNLPYRHVNESVFIWDNGQEIGVITFRRFLVWYSKSENRPSLKIVAPPTERGHDWHGLCGAFDGDYVNDLTSKDRQVVSYALTFASSWTSLEQENKLCLDHLDDDKDACPASRHHHFARFCKDFLQWLVAANCTPSTTKDACVNYLCLCYPKMGENCFWALKLPEEEWCYAQGVNLPPDVNVMSHPSEGKLRDVTTIALWEQAVHLAQILRPVMQEYFGTALQMLQFIPHFKKAVGNVMKGLKPSLFEFFINFFPSAADFLQEISSALLKMEEALVPPKIAFLNAFTLTFRDFLLEIEPYLLQYAKIMLPVCEFFFHYTGTVLQVLIEELGPTVFNYLQKCLEGCQEVLTEVFESLSFIDTEVKEIVDIYRVGKIFLELEANLTQIKTSEMEQAQQILKREVILVIRATTSRIMATGIKRKSLQCILDPTGFYSQICPGCMDQEN
ncbi:uncharacterized protein [Panulirus ornatus]|uniref:uncharacterized protein isoform X2 n=1 Tax=Panulirus ornatus TaxID=150431 RepID=UPI003A875B12